MTSPPVIYAVATERLEYPIWVVWPLIASFGGLHHWADGVSTCSVDGKGVGAVRRVVRNGNAVRERLEAIDPAGHLLRYRILPPHSIPADNVHGMIVLRASDDAETEMVWRSDATDFRIAPDVLGARIEHFYRESIAGLRALLGAR